MATDLLQRRALYGNPDPTGKTPVSSTPPSSAAIKKVKKKKKRSQIDLASTEPPKDPGTDRTSANKPSTDLTTISIERDKRKGKKKRVPTSHFVESQAGEQKQQQEFRPSRPNTTTKRSSERVIESCREASQKQVKNHSDSQPKSNIPKNIPVYPTSPSSSRRKAKKESASTLTPHTVERQGRKVEKSKKFDSTLQSARTTQASKTASERNPRNQYSSQYQLENPRSDKSTSLESSSSGSRSNSTRLGFDGAIEASPSSSRSTIGSLESLSSGSRSNSRRLGFDGVIQTSTQTPPERKSKKRDPSPPPKSEHQSQVTRTNTLGGSTKSNTTSGATQRSRPSQQSESHLQSLASSKTKRNKHNVHKSMASDKNEIDGKIEMALEKSETAGLFADNQGGERSQNSGIESGNVQPSGCTTRKKIVWGSILCFIIIAISVAVPCILLLGGSSGGNNFPKLSNVGGDEVVASITTDICNEAVPRSGSCTPIDVDDERLGGELCNLVAKSMINTTTYGDIALINAGICLRTLYAPELTASNIEDAISAERLVAIEIPGVDIVRILTQSVTTTFAEPGNAQAYPYAAGLRYSVQANLPPSERVSNVEVNRGLRDDEWEAIDIRRFYKVITTETLANGGMGYKAFENVIDDWKEPLGIGARDAFYDYAVTKSNYTDEWSVLPSSEYSTQYYIDKYAEPAIAAVPSRICHALIPGQPESPFCTTDDVSRGGEVCNLLSWTIYDQNLGIDMVILKADSCTGDIEEGDFAMSTFDIILSENKPLVTINLLGSEILALVNDRVDSALDSGAVGNYPYAAGLKFDVRVTSIQKVSNIQVHTPSGSWTPIEDGKTYTVTTTSDVVGSSNALDMGTTMEKEFISYAEDWKVLYKTPEDKASTQSYA